MIAWFSRSCKQHPDRNYFQPKKCISIYGAKRADEALLVSMVRPIERE